MGFAGLAVAVVAGLGWSWGGLGREHERLVKGQARVEEAERRAVVAGAGPRVRVADDGRVLVDDTELVIHLDGGLSAALHGGLHGPRRVVDIQAGRARGMQEPDWQMHAQSFPRSGLLIETYLRKDRLAAGMRVAPVLASGLGAGADLVPAFFAHVSAGWPPPPPGPRPVWERPVAHPTLDALTPSAPVPFGMLMSSSFRMMARSYALSAGVQDVVPVIHFAARSEGSPPPAGATEVESYDAVSSGRVLMASALPHPRQEQARVMLCRGGCWYLPGQRFRGVLELRGARVVISDRLLVSKRILARELLRPEDAVRQEDAVWTLNLGGTEVALYFGFMNCLQDVAITRAAWTGGAGGPAEAVTAAADKAPAACVKPPGTAAELEAERDRRIAEEVDMELWRRRAVDRVRQPQPLVLPIPVTLSATPSREPGGAWRGQVMPAGSASQPERGPELQQPKGTGRRVLVPIPKAKMLSDPAPAPAAEVPSSSRQRK